MFYTFFNEDLISHWLRTSCSGYDYTIHNPFRFIWKKKSATNIKDLVDGCSSGCSMSVPTVGMLNKDWGNGVAYRRDFAVSFF